MSQDFMDPEIFADFIIEAREHLETIEPNLLELEQSPENLALLNEIFRPMHSLKGASGFLGLNKINKLAHRAENIMDELRKGRMAVTSEIMDIILSSTDMLRTMIENLESEGGEGEVDTESLMAALDALLAGDAPAPKAAAPKPAPAPKAAPKAPAPAPKAPAPAPKAPASAPKAPAPAPAFDAAPYALSVVAREHLDDFMEEAKEIVENLNSALVSLEKNPGKGGETVNDVFRYFHNLKGNSGIIGYRELNALTHEAETLLNRVRKGEMASSNAMIDLLLGVVDMIETLIGAIDTASAQVTPLDTAALVARLQAAVESGEVAPTAGAGPDEAPEAPAPAPASAPAPADSGAGADSDDLKVFSETVGQQLANITLALDSLEQDPGRKESVDGLHRSLVSVQNSAQYMGLDDIKINAERTAGLVAQARDADLDFALMVDILRQECGIIADIVAKEIERLGGGADLGGDEPLVSAMDEDAPEPVAPEAEPQPEPEAAADEAADDEEDEDRTVVQASAPRRPASGARGVDSTPAARPAPAAPRPDAASAAGAAASAAPAAGGKKPKVSSTIRVDHEKLDHLMNLIGELIINRNRFAMLARNMEVGGQSIDVSEVASNLTETTYAMARISDDLQDTIMKVRMVPVNTVFSRFPRLVRDLSRKSGKKVELIMEGEETELDKSVIEEIGDPLVHMIRNSVDHGLESNEDRLAKGKPEVGRVWLRAYHQGNSVAIEVEDDGRGIDPVKMREVGVKKGMITPEEAKGLDDQQAIGLIFEPGFSGAEKVTDISGRGVGMDVVKTNIKNLKGSVNINTEVGRGTRFTIALPLTLAIIDALMIKISGDTYAIPLEAVSETTKIEVRRFTEVNGRKAVTLRGEVLGIMDLCEVLGLPGNPEKRAIVPIVVIQDNNRRLGLVVDTLLERQEIVIKPLGDYLGEKEGLSGATIMGDGSVVLILDPHEIYRMSTNRGGSSGM